MANPLQYLCLEIPVDRRATVHRAAKESNTTEVTEQACTQGRQVHKEDQLLQADVSVPPKFLLQSPRNQCGCLWRQSLGKGNKG